MDRTFILSAFLFAIVGLLLGIIMAASKDHSQFPTHTHIMLAGFVVSFIYGLTHKLWLGNPTTALAKVQFFLHVAGTAVLVVGLYLLYGGFYTEAQLDPILAGSSFSIFFGMLLMTFIFIKSKPQSE